MRQEAFVLMGGAARARYPEFYSFLRGRGLRILYIDDPETVDQDWVRRLSNQPDRQAWCSARSFEAAVAQTLGWGEEYAVRGVYGAVEEFVTAAAVAADILGLPGAGVRAGMVARNKFLQRGYFPALSPRWQHHTAGEPPPSPAGRTVVKALDRHGGQGIHLADSPAALARALEAFDAGTALLVEAVADGIDINVDSLVHEGEAVFTNVSQEPPCPPGKNFLEMGYTIPANAVSMAGADAVRVANQKIVDILGIGSGMIHAEYRMPPGGSPVLIEFAVRNPGDGLLPMYQLSTGIPLEHQILRAMMGERPEYSTPTRPVRQVFFEHEAGVLDGVAVKGFDVDPTYIPLQSHFDPVSPARGAATLHRVEIEWAPGAVLPPLRRGADRLGSFLIEANGIDELDALERAVRQALVVTYR
ncbi:Putative biotin carboxylase [Parafrankia sp. Ea1.12]|uniref:ATP-grasp domain-containing protein n=1 Tax=Parafrankia sp. Ea1.12 TaxID=573499 RepID=UPI000DA43285|nr:ATP-grasp domain-containing protein [Parafrankia sp. Ea1.12]SQD97620.1 Putative biotin carboxylase [Parafrankia sp. Ea1.12]